MEIIILETEIPKHFQTENHFWVQKTDPLWVQKTDHFWCSALVGYIYTQSKILKSNTDWSIMRPCDFSTKQQNLNLINNATLGEEIKIL